MIAWLNSNSGFLTLVVAFMTFVVAIITVIVAKRTYGSQMRSEELQKEVRSLQKETYDSQIRAEKIQQQTAAIQARMDARDLEFRKSRAEAGSQRLLYRIEVIHNLGREFWLNDAAWLAQDGWQEEISYLPECELKSRAGTVFCSWTEASRIKDGHTKFYKKICDIHDEIQKFKTDCREAINRML